MAFRFDTGPVPDQEELCMAREADWDTTTDLIYLCGEFGIESVKAFINALSHQEEVV